MSSDMDDLYVAVVPPIIDIDALIHPDRYHYHDIEKMRAVIYHASQRWGFFQVVNHSIPEQLQLDIVHSMILLFGSSHELKNSIRRSVTNSRGFADDELTKRQKDMKEVFDIGQVPHKDLSAAAMINQDIDGTNQWPDPRLYPHLQHFKATVEEYYLQCTQLSNRLFQLLITPFLECEQVNDNTTQSNDYNDKDDDVRNAFNKHSSFMRLNYYPMVNTSRNEAVGPDAGESDGGDASERDANSVDVGDGRSGETFKTVVEPFGVSRHTDSGALTVLLQVLPFMDGMGWDEMEHY